jgi:hypothetical protein
MMTSAALQPDSGCIRSTASALYEGHSRDLYYNALQPLSCTRRLLRPVISAFVGL